MLLHLPSNTFWLTPEVRQTSRSSVADCFVTTSEGVTIELSMRNLELFSRPFNSGCLRSFFPKRRRGEGGVCWHHLPEAIELYAWNIASEKWLQIGKRCYITAWFTETLNSKMSLTSKKKTLTWTKCLQQLQFWLKMILLGWKRQVFQIQIGLHSSWTLVCKSSTISLLWYSKAMVLHSFAKIFLQLINLATRFLITLEWNYSHYLG